MKRLGKSIEAERYGYWGILVLLLFILIYGCATYRAAPTGFLTDYQRLKADPKEEGISWWETPGVRWGKYKRLIIDPVEVRIDTTKAEREMTPEEMEKLAGSLRKSVVEAMRPRYPVVERTGPDVLRIRAALTHLKPVSPATNVITTVVLMMPVDVGEAAVEVQFIDSVSGKILSELMASQQGSIMAVTQVWTRWSQVEQGFKDWARKLRAAMAEVDQSTK
jgi:hypothetical protein